MGVSHRCAPPEGSGGQGERESRTEAARRPWERAAAGEAEQGSRGPAARLDPRPAAAAAAASRAGSRGCGGGAPDRRSCPERRRALGGSAVSPAGRSAARAMRTEFGAVEAEHGRPMHLLPGALRALPAFLAPSRLPRGE